MIHEPDEKLDGRDIRDGKFSWTENLLDDVFAPLIGAAAARLYTVLCRMIPDKQRNPHTYDLSNRRMEKVSRLSLGTVHRSLDVLVALGMIERSRPVYAADNTPWEYKLPTLSDLNLAGTKELLRRLPVPPDEDALISAWLDLHEEVKVTPKLLKRMTVPPGNALHFDEWFKLHPKYKGPKPETYVQGAGKSDKAVKGPLFAPAETPEQSVPRGNAAENVEEEPIFDDGGAQAFQEPRGSVPQTGGERSTRAGEAFHRGTPIHKLTKSLPEPTTPLPPSQARGSDAPGAERRTAEQRELDSAIAKVRRECRLSEPRMEGIIRRALELEAGKTDEPPQWNAIAERIIAAYERYVDLGKRGLLRYPVRARRFVQELWDKDGLWGVDEDELRRQNAAKRL